MRNLRQTEQSHNIFMLRVPTTIKVLAVQMLIVDESGINVIGFDAQGIEGFTEVTVVEEGLPKSGEKVTVQDFEPDFDDSLYDEDIDQRDFAQDDDVANLSAEDVL